MVSNLPRKNIQLIKWCFLKKGNLDVNNYRMFEKKKKTLKKPSEWQKEEHKETKQDNKDKISKQRHPISLLVQ